MGEVTKMIVEKLNFITNFGGIKGYSQGNVETVLLMEELGMDVRAQNLQDALIKEIEHLQKKPVHARCQLLKEIPTVNPNADIYWTFTEFDEPTYGSIPLLQKAKGVIVESEFCRDIFSKFTEAPIHRIDIPLADKFKINGNRVIFNELIENFGFKFLGVFEWIMRKDPYTLIRCFCEEFEPTEDVCLILRTWSKFQNPHLWIPKLARDHNVFWLKDTIEDMSALYRSVDCLASASLGEGLGRTHVESMACGCLNILPDSTAMSEYANKSNALTITTEPHKVGDRLNELGHLIKDYFVVQVPDPEEIKAAMRIAFEQQGTGILRKNSLKIRDKFTTEITKQQIREAFEL